MRRNKQPPINLEERNQLEKLEELPIALRKPTRTPIPHSITNYLNYEMVSTNYRTFHTTLSQETIPTTVEEACQYPHWKVAIDEEMQASIKNQTWEVVVNLEKGIKPVR